MKHLSEKEKDLQKQQAYEASILTSDVKLTCECGRSYNVLDMYKCLYCDIYRCKECSEVHFGASIDSWRGNILTRIYLKGKRMVGLSQRTKGVSEKGLL